MFSYCCFERVLTGVVVEQKATVRDLKAAIRRHLHLKLSREGVSKHINWYVSLIYGLKKTLIPIGIRNKIFIDQYQFKRDYHKRITKLNIIEFNPKGGVV